MVRVVKKGPNHEEHELTCSNCRSVLSATKNEAIEQDVGTNWGESYTYHVICPVCNAKVNFP